VFAADELFQSPNALASHYQRFRVAERLLLSGHSHQAWPDVGFEGQQQAWLDAAEYVDAKWEHAFARAESVRQSYSRLLDDTGGAIALAENTHELLIKFLSALPLVDHPRIVTTDGEFHAMRRQLDRLAEEGIEVVKVPADNATEVAERMAGEVNDRTAAAMVSAVFYQNANIVPNLSIVAKSCRRHGVPLLVDAYHVLNVIPYSIREEQLEDAYFVGGGYKYCQLGEGNAFLRLPANCELRPVVTGWYSEFDTMTETKRQGEVLYGGGPWRFAGATYDPTSHYRAAAVFEFFDEHELTPRVLREVSQHQIKLIAERFDALSLPPHIITREYDTPIESIGGFMVLRSPHAGQLQRLLYEAGVYTDSRAEYLRLGPAPYLSDAQIVEAVDILGEIVRALPAS